MKDFAVGVDVGNYDTKSQNTITPSGYTDYISKPLMASEMLFYNGKYYVPSLEERLPYVMNKTQNDQALILTLFGIAKEILYYFRENPNYKGKIQSTAQLQEEVNNIETISLGVGLPPGHLDSLSEDTERYYLDTMGNGIKFSYKDNKLKDAVIEFNFKLNNFKIFPQDFSAVLMNDKLTIPSSFSKYVVIGVGGYTVDIIPVIDRQSNVERCTSLNLGTRPMYESIMNKVQAGTGISISERSIEDVLFNRPHILDDKVVNIIKDVAATHSSLIINRCHQTGIEFSENPIVFVGGGALLLRPFFESNELIKKCEFVDSVNGNAQHFAKFLVAGLKSSKKQD